MEKRRLDWWCEPDSPSMRLGKCAFSEGQTGDARCFRAKMLGSQDEVWELAEALEQAGVRWTQTRRRPVPAVRYMTPRNVPMMSVATQDLRSYQTYFDALEIHSASAVPGARGDGVEVVDIEFGWNLEHEDLRGRVQGVSYASLGESHHGTAVLGVLGSADNGRGTLGIVPNAALRVENAGWLDNGWNASSAIYRAVYRLRPGDVIILEMHEPGPLSDANSDDEDFGFVPVEWGRAERHAVRLATRKGIHVVSAAGNGGVDLGHAAHNGAFADDTGSIMVGAGVSDQANKHDFSNYGSRVTVHGWGDSVATTGGDAPYYRELTPHASSPHAFYTDRFAGTSAAAPMVAGVVASISGALRARGTTLSPSDMRRLIAETGTRPVHGIGTLPNLRRALKSLEIL